jgi:Zn-dependent protease with chaperone function
MEMKEDFFTDSKEAVKEYLEERLLLLKLKMVDKISKGVAMMAIFVICIILGAVFLILLGIFGGFFFSSLTGGYASGFAIITGIYLIIIVLVLIVLKNWIQSSIINKIIRHLLSQNKVK